METVTIDQPLPRRADNTDPVNMPGKVVRLQAAAHFVDEPNPPSKGGFPAGRSNYPLWTPALAPVRRCEVDIGEKDPLSGEEL